MRSLRFLGLITLALLTPFVASAGPSVPEIDPGSAVTALTLASGALFMITGRSRRSR